jgi:hypothetical protein
MKCLGHEAMRGHAQYVYRITAVPISLSLVTQAGLLENLHRLDTMIVEKVAKKGARQGGVAAFKCGIVRWKVGFASGAMTVVIAVGRAARATAESTTSSRSVILAVRHVPAGVSKAGKVDAGPAACDSKCSPG